MEDRQGAFRALYDEQFDAVAAYARRRSATAADADDVVAETFLVAWRRLEEMPTGEACRPWLYGVAGRVLANQRRGSARRRRLGERLRAERPAGQADQSAESPVARAFDALTAGEREVLGLAYWEDLDPGEIALALGCSRNAARIRLHRARRSLAREMEMTEGARIRAAVPMREEGAR